MPHLVVPEALSLAGQHDEARSPVPPPAPPPDDAAGRLAAIVQSSEDAIISKTLEGVITSWNPAAERLFGYTAAEAIGQRITLIIPPDRRQEEASVLASVRSGRSVEHFETVRQAKDGRRIDISLTVSPVRNAAGVIVGASKIARDITDRVRAERDRADLLAREQAAREEAEALNRAKDQFLAVLSHELRTPLNAIFGWARMLHEGQLDPALRARGTEAILRNAKAQLQLVEDLLDVSRIITGAMRLEMRPVDLRTVVDAALETVRPTAGAKDLDVEAVLDPDAVTVMGAPDRLQQVVWNLLVNAVKFTPKGGRIHVRLRRAGSHVELAVSDTGEGITSDVLPHVFERFRQGDSSTTRAHGGLGIGLALVRHLVDLHGGTVRAESPGPGQGATFTVRLPLALRSVEATAASDVRVATSLDGLRVLIADDDVDGLEFARLVVERAGAEVRACLAASEVRRTLADWPADVLVLDIEMPDEDGLALVRALRDAGTRTPAIALTGHGAGEDRKRALASGFDLHLSKPVDPGELATAIATLAGRRP
jgi:PAS domain S-box-containing protein